MLGVEEETFVAVFFRALASAGSRSSLRCVRQNQSMRDLYMVLHGLAG